MTDPVKFLKSILRVIAKADPLHAKTLKRNLSSGGDFDMLLEVVYEYFLLRQIDSKTVADDYLRMIRDMRTEGLYFNKFGTYSCKSQSEANEKVYSNSYVMGYYMNALIISQVLWSHHFKMLMYFKEHVSSLKGYIDVLDIGAGHGLYSYYVRERVPLNSIDILDISYESLFMTRDMIGDNVIYYICGDINKYEPAKKYSLIILGEVLEHLDNPSETLKKIHGLLKADGTLWVTVPTNAPAIDHVYLFRDKGEVFDMLDQTGFKVTGHFDVGADGLTRLIGAFCKIK